MPTSRKPRKVTADEFYGRKPGRKAKPAELPPADLKWSGRIPPGYRVGLVPQRPNWWPWRMHAGRPRRRMTAARLRRRQLVREVWAWSAGLAVAIVAAVALSRLVPFLRPPATTGKLTIAAGGPAPRPAYYNPGRDEVRTPEPPAPAAPQEAKPCNCCQRILAAIRTHEAAHQAALDAQVPPPPPAAVATRPAPPPLVGAPAVRRRCQAIASSTGKTRLIASENAKPNGLQVNGQEVRVQVNAYIKA